MIVDAHHHFWDPARGDYRWLTDDLAAIRRSFAPADLAPLIEAHGIDATVLVQTRSSLDETREFIATAEAVPFVRGVIGWVDLTDPAVADVIAAFRAGPGRELLVGIRHQVHDEPDPAWLLREDVRRGIAAVSEAGLVYDLLVRSRELPAARELVASMPDARFVVDHLAKPSIRDGTFQPWADLVTSFSGFANVAWKLSGLVTEADWMRWTTGDLAPFIEHALMVLGSDRLIFGSDWPVCLLAATYDKVLATAQELTAGLSPSEHAAVFGENARAIYRL